jgi:hypothetical protein
MKDFSTLPLPASRIPERFVHESRLDRRTTGRPAKHRFIQLSPMPFRQNKFPSSGFFFHLTTSLPLSTDPAEKLPSRAS